MFNIKTRKEKMMVTKARLEGLDKDLTLVLGLTVVGNVLAETGTIPMVATIIIFLYLRWLLKGWITAAELKSNLVYGKKAARIESGGCSR